VNVLEGVASRIIAGLNGRQEMGRTWAFWLGFVIVVGGTAAAPAFLSKWQLFNLNNFLISGFMGLSLCLLWGFGGILSLGQAAFMGLAGYSYGVIGINLIEEAGNTDLALLGGLVAPVLLAAALGGIMFFARVQSISIAILMLLVTLMFETFLNQTAGPGWNIGRAHLGGNNGLGRFAADIRDPPSLSLGLGDHLIHFPGRSHAFFYLTLFLLVAVYLMLRVLVNSRFGHVLIAIREDADRTEAFGHDVRLIQLLVFCISALIAGVAGILYVSWGNFITPDAFGVYNNILPVIWVAFGGRKSLTASALSAVFLVWLSQTLAIQGNYAQVALGLILIVVMMLLPEGAITQLANAIERRWHLRKEVASESLMARENK
jgi:ABC-type branched-subunit amino acid transport system permease subunit